MLAPRLSETSAFVTVVEQKSFTRAAKQLALSTARVSRQVRPALKALIDFLRDAHRGTSVRRKPAAAR